MLVVDHGQVKNRVSMGDYFAVSCGLLGNQVDLPSGIGPNTSCCLPSVVALSTCTRLMILSICNDSQIIHALTRTHTVHVLHNAQVAFSLLVLESLHELLSFRTSDVKSSLLISQNLLVPSACERVVIGCVFCKFDELVVSTLSLVVSCL